MSEWREVRVQALEDEGLIAPIQDGNHGEIHPKTTDYVPSGVPFVMAKDLKEGRLDTDECAYITREQADSLRVGFGRGDDVLLSHKGTLGRVAIVPHECKLAMLTPQVTYYRVLDSSRLDRRFLAYSLRSRHFQQQLYGYSSQSTRQYVSLRTQRELSILLPEIGVQRRIAHILGALDDKIELNRRINRTLEAIARAIFKSWFIDFDPVYAKAEGREPVGMDLETAALFPDSFQDSPLGKIPEGWEVGTIGALGEIVCGKTPPTAQPENYGRGIPFITIPDMRGSVFVVETSRELTQIGATTQPKKLLPAETVCVSCIATLGLVSLTSVPSHTNQQINSVVCSDDVSPYWCYLQLRSMHDEIITGGAGGSATLNLNKGQFSALTALLPPTSLREAFHDLVKPIFAEILLSTRQVGSAVQVRDVLLPKLLSGDLSP